MYASLCLCIIFFYVPPVCYAAAKKRILTVHHGNLSAHLTLDSCLQRSYLWTNVKPLWHTHLLLCAQKGHGGTKCVWAWLSWTFPSEDSKAIPKGFNRSNQLPFYHPATLPASDRQLCDPGIPIVMEIHCPGNCVKQSWVCRHLCVRWTTAHSDSCACVCVFKTDQCWQGYPPNQWRDTVVSTRPQQHHSSHSGTLECIWERMACCNVYVLIFACSVW